MVADGKKIKMKKAHPKYYLTVNWVDNPDAGFYNCEVKTADGEKLPVSFKLVVQGTSKFRVGLSASHFVTFYPATLTNPTPQSPRRYLVLSRRSCTTPSPWDSNSTTGHQSRRSPGTTCRARKRSVSGFEQTPSLISADSLNFAQNTEC